MNYDSFHLWYCSSIFDITVPSLIFQIPLPIQYYKGVTNKHNIYGSKECERTDARTNHRTLKWIEQTTHWPHLQCQQLCSRVLSRKSLLQRQIKQITHCHPRSIFTTPRVTAVVFWRVGRLERLVELSKKLIQKTSKQIRNEFSQKIILFAKIARRIAVRR